MDNLRIKFDEMKKNAEEDLQRTKADMNCNKLKLDEIKMLRGETHINMEDVKQGHEDKLIVKLRQAL